VVGAGQHHEERRRVERAVVAAEGHLAGRRHLAGPRLVHHLARLGVPAVVLAVRLRRREVPQRAARDRRIEPQAL
jgi:hypothetical protein